MMSIKKQDEYTENVLIQHLAPALDSGNNPCMYDNKQVINPRFEESGV